MRRRRHKRSSRRRLYGAALHAHMKKRAKRRSKHRRSR